MCTNNEKQRVLIIVYIVNGLSSLHLLMKTVCNCLGMGKAMAYIYKSTGINNYMYVS